MRDNFGDWLRQKIKESGKTQKEFADIIGIEQPHLSRILSNTRGASNEILIAIAHALKLPPETIFRTAGLLPPVPSDTQYAEEVLFLLNQLSPPDQLEILELLRFKAERKLERKKATPTTVSRKVKSPAQTILNG